MKQKFELVDLKTPSIHLSGGSDIIYSLDIREYIKFVNSISDEEEPTMVFSTVEGHLYTKTSDGLVFMYIGDELSTWRKEFSKVK